MSARGLTAAAITALGTSPVTFHNLIRIDFSTPLYYTDSPHDITYGGNTYLSTANIEKFPDIKESLGIKPSTVSFKFTGSLANQALVLTEDSANAEVYYYRYFPTDSSGITLFQGYIDDVSASEDEQGGKSEVTYTVASHWANWEAQNGRFISSVSQARIGYSSDKFFEFAGVTDGLLDYWGGYRTTDQISGGYMRVYAVTKALDIRSNTMFSSLGAWWNAPDKESGI